MFGSVVLDTGQVTSLMKTDNLGREDFSSNDEANVNWNHLCCHVHCIYLLIHLCIKPKNQCSYLTLNKRKWRLGEEKRFPQNFTA